jgi:hypothetical protein
MNQGINNQGENRYGHDEDCPGRTMVLSMTWSRDSNGASIGANGLLWHTPNGWPLERRAERQSQAIVRLPPLGTGDGVKNEA